MTFLNYARMAFRAGRVLDADQLSVVTTTYGYVMQSLIRLRQINVSRPTTNRWTLAAASDLGLAMEIKDVRPVFLEAGRTRSMTDWRDPERGELRKLPVGAATPDC